MPYHRCAGKMRSGAAWTIALAAAGIPAAAAAAQYTLAPITVTGELAYAVAQRDFRLREDEVEQFLNLRVNANTFIWQPWFARLSGGLNFGIRNTERDTSSDDSTLTGGHARVRVFPGSRFPFEAYYERDDSRNDSRSLIGAEPDQPAARSVVINDYLSTRYGVTQSYSSPRATYYTFRAEHNDITDDGGTDRLDAVDFGVSGMAGRHSLSLNTKFRNLEIAEPRERTQDFRALLTHSFRPTRTSSVNNQLDLDRETNRFADSGTEQTTSTLQYNGFGTWAPPGARKPLNLYGTARVDMIRFDARRDEFASASSAENYDLSASAVYDWSRHLQYYGGASAGMNSSSGSASDTFTTQFAGTRYRPDDIPLGRWSYNWSAAADLTNETGDTSSQSLGAGAGHGLARNWVTGTNSNLALNLSQSLTARETTDEAQSQQDLMDQVALRWARQSGPGQTFAGVSLSDNRTFGDDAGDTQLLNVQVNQNLQFGRYASLTGGITGQWSRFSDEDVGDGAPRTSQSVAANVRYAHNRVFQVPRLSFTSELVVLDSDYESREIQTLDAEERLVRERLADRSWNNELTYRIGRLELALIGRLAEFNDEREQTVMLRARRFFARRF